MADGNAPKRIFLRKVLYRMDFQFITEQNQEEIYSHIVDRYGDYFEDCGREQGNALEIELNASSPNSPKFNSNIQNVCYLKKNKAERGDGRTIKIGRTFIFFDIDLALDNENLPYYTWFAEIVEYIADSLKKRFRPVRMGLRKFNQFYILDKDFAALDSIFRTAFVDDKSSGFFKLDHFDDRQFYSGDNYSINYFRNYSTGLLSNQHYNNEVAHLINFDFDIYTDNIEELRDFCSNARPGLEQMNSQIYTFFESIINPEIVTQINSGSLLEEFKVIPF